MMKPAFASLICIFLLGADTLARETATPLDLSQGRTLYEVGYSHLDTEYRWAYPQVIHDFLPNTVHDNLKLFEKYPDYIFNWTGANRYRLMQEYHPADFAAVRAWVAKGRWFPAGNSWEENDVNVPSPESEIRQIMFGHEFFKKEFGVESSEYMIPDCFGFPASLPSVLAHCGLRGFSTQKLTWGSAVGIPFNVGVWVGLDGNSVIAALNPGAYGTSITKNLSTDTHWLERIDLNGAKSGVFADYAYYGVGDRGGAPTEKSVQWLEKSVHTAGPVRVISARADQMFNDISDAQKEKLPKYRGDLLLTEHSAGTLTSEAYMKKWNRENELLANAAETAAVAAQLLGSALYPREKLHHAWELVLACQFHDELPGTALPKVYEYCWNDEIIAMNSFAEVLQNSVGAVARDLDTRTDGTALIVYNPLSIAREDVVEAELDFPTPPKSLQVFDGNGKPVPTQMLSTDATKAHFLFLAQVPPTGFKVFSVKETAVAATNSSLKVSSDSLENDHYRVGFNSSGDLASVFDKVAKRELLTRPARLDFLTESPTNYPAWNMDWADQQKPPRDYVTGSAKFRMVENGPVRVAVEIVRQAENSIFTQTIRLAAEGAGDRIEIANHIDWQSKACALKADFPLTISNPWATYNWDLGKIQRANNDPKKYEVPSHQWFDLTDRRGDYGVSILAPDKYGSDKPADNELRLTLLYTPGITNVQARNTYREQQWQDWGQHDFIYGLYAHSGDWRAGKSDWQSARLSQPLLAFRTPSHDGKLGKEFSLLRLDSDQVAVRSIKLAEDRDEVVVRLQELNGAKAKSVSLSAIAGIKSATEVTGIETPLHALDTVDDKLALDFTPYQIRSLALVPVPPEKLSPPICQPLDLPYNLDAFSVRGMVNKGDFDGAGGTIPSEMIGDTVMAEGIQFKIAPHDYARKNALSCQGQTILLPAGKFNRLYLLAAAVKGDTDGTFRVNDQPTTLHVQNWTGMIGSWDNRIFAGSVKRLNYSITNQMTAIATGFIKRAPLAWFCSHHRLADGSDAIYAYSYLFKYCINLPIEATTLTLPDNPGIRILAASLSQDENDDTPPAHPLYDDFTGREPTVLRDHGNSSAN